MMLAILFFAIALALIYVLLLRPILRKRPELAAFYDRADAVELGLWAHLRERLKGLKTLLAARLYLIIGILVSLHDYLAPQLSGIDWGPILPAGVTGYWPLILIFTGLIFEYLRRKTNTPVGQSVPDPKA